MNFAEISFDFNTSSAMRQLVLQTTKVQLYVRYQHWFGIYGRPEGWNSRQEAQADEVQQKFTKTYLKPNSNIMQAPAWCLRGLSEDYTVVSPWKRAGPDARVLQVLRPGGP